MDMFAYSKGSLGTTYNISTSLWRVARILEMSYKTCKKTDGSKVLWMFSPLDV